MRTTMIQTLLLTFITLVAFAANSILCRMALMADLIGPLEFTLIRLGSGILVLLPLLFIGRKKDLTKEEFSDPDSDILSLRWGNIAPSLALFSYALFFSLAYIELDAGIGALILFASVQTTMMGVSVFLGNRVSAIEWSGFGLAFLGLVYLLLPGLSAPSLSGTIMMILSGISWGVYSLLGKNQPQPILSTARNFLFCLPACLLLLGAMVGFGLSDGWDEVQSRGVTLGILSGGLASGGGYVLWYISLRRITTTVASIAQLSVPIIAGIAGILLLNEALSLRLVLSSMLILGGIVVAVLGKGALQRYAAGRTVQH